MERATWKHTSPRVEQRANGDLLCDLELNPVLCASLEGWDGVGDGREVQEGGDICTPVADSC